MHERQAREAVTEEPVLIMERRDRGAVMARAGDVEVRDGKTVAVTSTEWVAADPSGVVQDVREVI